MLPACRGNENIKLEFIHGDSTKYLRCQGFDQQWIIDCNLGASAVVSMFLNREHAKERLCDHTHVPIFHIAVDRRRWRWEEILKVQRNKVSFGCLQVESTRSLYKPAGNVAPTSHTFLSEIQLTSKLESTLISSRVYKKSLLSACDRQEHSITEDSNTSYTVFDVLVIRQTPMLLRLYCLPT